MRGVRRRIAERLTTAWTEIPHITYVDAVDATEVERLRAALNGRNQSPRLTLLPFIARATIDALKEFPVVNSSFFLEERKAIYHRSVNLGVAIDLITAAQKTTSWLHNQGAVELQSPLSGSHP